MDKSPWTGWSSYCEMKVFGVTLPGWGILARVVSGRLVLDMLVAFGGGDEQRSAGFGSWAKEFDSNPSKLCPKREPNHIWTTRLAAQALSWVIDGAWTRKRLYDLKWTDGKSCKCCPAEGTEKRRLWQGHQKKTGNGRGESSRIQSSATITKAVSHGSRRGSQTLRGGWDRTNPLRLMVR